MMTLLPIRRRNCYSFISISKGCNFLIISSKKMNFLFSKRQWKIIKRKMLSCHLETRIIHFSDSRKLTHPSNKWSNTVTHPLYTLSNVILLIKRELISRAYRAFPWENSLGLARTLYTHTRRAAALAQYKNICLARARIRRECESRGEEDEEEDVKEAQRALGQPSVYTR